MHACPGLGHALVAGWHSVLPGKEFPTMTDTMTDEQQAFLDGIAEHIAAIHVASREFITSRKGTNDPGPSKLRITLETSTRQPMADPGDPDIDGKVEVESYCPEGTVPIFVAYDCDSDDPFACRDVVCM
jgi:hypothetical protein